MRRIEIDKILVTAGAVLFAAGAARAGSLAIEGVAKEPVAAVDVVAERDSGHDDAEFLMGLVSIAGGAACAATVLVRREVEIAAVRTIEVTDLTATLAD